MREPQRWDKRSVRALRKHLGVSQDALAEELGTRQQTVSEWETGQYQPRGTSAKLLGIIAERAGFEYEAVSSVDERSADALHAHLEGPPNEPSDIDTSLQPLSKRSQIQDEPPQAADSDRGAMA